MHHHLAILRVSSRLLEKILSGQKKIESRWYCSRIAPWDRIKKGDIVYFKYSGKAVTAKATVKKVLQFSDLTPLKVNYLWQRYFKEIGVDREEDINRHYKLTMNKKYCIL